MAFFGIAIIVSAMYISLSMAEANADPFDIMMVMFIGVLVGLAFLITGAGNVEEIKHPRYGDKPNKQKDDHNDHGKR